MRRIRKTRLPAIAFGLGVLFPAAIAAPSWHALAVEPGPVSATAGQVGSPEAVRHDDRQSPPASEREVSGRAATLGSNTAGYDNLDQAWQAIRSDGMRLKASMSADWRTAVDEFEQDRAAVTNGWQRLTSN